jgi:putative endonuclease
MKTTERGDAAEARAEHFLRRQGLSVLQRNYRTRRGEIDLVMRRGPLLVFVEVRYRKRLGYGDPAETVDRSKQRRIAAAARAYLNDALAPPGITEIRFDVVTLQGDPATGAIAWWPDAFDDPAP